MCEVTVLGLLVCVLLPVVAVVVGKIKQNKNKKQKGKKNIDKCSGTVLAAREVFFSRKHWCKQVNFFILLIFAMTIRNMVARGARGTKFAKYYY